MDVLIIGEHVLTGPPGQRIDEGAVLVRDERIAAVGPAAELENGLPPDVPTVRFPGATIMPGLFNCHVHLAFDTGPDPMSATREADGPGLVLGMAARALQLLGSGVTTARDLGDRDGLGLRLRDAITRGELPGPRLLVAGAPLTVPAGHCWYLGGEVDGVGEALELVRRHAAAGVDVVKVMVSGGQTTAGGAAMWESQFDQATLAAIVAEAHRVGRPVAAHAHGTASIAAAVAAGVDTIEHCTWLTDGEFDPRDDIAAEIANRGITVCPTASPNWRRLATFVGAERAAALHGRLRWLDEHGVRLVAGSDAGLRGSVFDDPVTGLELYEELGFPRERILELATSGAADGLGLTSVTGRLAAGLSADVLVVDGDPLADLGALRAVRLVLARGRAHVPTAALAA